MNRDPLSVLLYIVVALVALIVILKLLAQI